MTGEPQLFETRVNELTQLIEDHLARGSLDEGNAIVFDRIIDAWLTDEIARLDGAVTDWANDEASARAASAAARAASEAEREHRHLRERAADERWQRITDVHHAARAVADEARSRRQLERVRAAEERLEQARLDVARARQLLLGSASTPTSAGPTTRGDAGDEGPLEHGPDEVG